MECKHPFYHIVDGRLLCTQCNEESPKNYPGRPSPIEDKMTTGAENKGVQWPPESRRVKIPKRR